MRSVRLTKPVTYNIQDLTGETVCFLPARTSKSKPRGVSHRQGIEEKKKERRRNERGVCKVERIQ